MKFKINKFKLFVAATAVSSTLFSAVNLHAQVGAQFGIDPGASAAELAASSNNEPADNPYTGTGLLGESFTLIGAPGDARYEMDTGTNPNATGSPEVVSPVSVGDGVTLAVTGSYVSTGGYATNVAYGFSDTSATNTLFEGEFQSAPENATSGSPGALTFTFNTGVDNALYNIVAYDAYSGDLLTTNLGSTTFTGSQTDRGTLAFGTNAVEFQGTTDASGNLVITLTGADTMDPTNGDNYSSLSGLSIEEAVPEPTTWALMGVSVLALVFFARRRLNA